MTPADGPEAAAALEGARSTLEQVWTTMLADPGQLVAVVDFPDHGNVGDSAIWLGERRLLAAGAAVVAYVCSTATYQPHHLEGAVGPTGTILLHGGGNFGDLWPRHQAFREAVAERFPRARIVQLPQSLHFQDADAVERAARAFADHPDFRLLYRDHASEDLAARISGNRATLCPDAAFALRPVRELPPVVDVLFLLRGDRERIDRGPVPSTLLQNLSWRVVDWPVDPFRAAPEAGRLQSALLARRRRARRALLTTLGARPATARVAAGHWDRLATRRVHGGLELLTSGRVVITDRLHGHILCLIAGVPHVFLDNSYGKITSFATTWNTMSRGARSAGSLETAIDIARDLLA